MPYLFDAWYVAAWSSEVVGDAILARTFLDVPVMLYRDAAGAVVALHDVCPHRFAPLSLGRIVDDGVRCGYHGLTFDRRGNCIHNLFSPAVPRAAKVRSFAVHERQKAIWIWMGAGDPADTDTIPDLPHQDDPAMRCLFGVTRAQADYRLLSDNLMDLTHTAVLHPAFGGLDYIPKYRSWEEGETIYSQYIIEQMPSFTGGDGTVRNHDEIRWSAPANHVLESRITERATNSVTYIPSAHLLTPESEKTTHYFWSSAMDADSPVSDEDMYETLVQAFDREDKPMVEAVQRRMGDADLWELDPILLSTDAGSVRVRRRLAALIEEERRLRESAPVG